MRKKLQQAYEQPTYDKAKQAVSNIRAELKLLNESAVRSLDEGLEETLTLYRLGVFQELGLSLKTTNCLESHSVILSKTFIPSKTRGQARFGFRINSLGIFSSNLRMASIKENTLKLLQTLVVSLTASYRYCSPGLHQCGREYHNPQIDTPTMIVTLHQGLSSQRSPNKVLSGFQLAVIIGEFKFQVRQFFLKKVLQVF